MSAFDFDPSGDDEESLAPLEDELEDTSQFVDSERDDNEDHLEKAWEKKQRELVTSVLDYNLSTLSDLITNKQIDLSPRYQRRDRWKPPRQSMLIESFLMNVPVPPIFLNEDNYGTYSVIDGKQRLTAIHQFMRGRLRLQGLKVFEELNGKTIDDLSANFKNVIATRSNLRATIILRQSDNQVKFEVFRRLNTGGVRLNAQEIRNSTWPGPLNDLLLDLSEEPIFQSLVGITRPDASTLYKEMRDVELVLRFMTFRTSWQSFSGGVSRRMDEFMADNQRPGKVQLDQMRSDFVNALNVVETAFGAHAFRRFTPETGLWRKPILAALFDAQMFSAREYSPDEVSPHSDDIQDANMALFSDPNFRRTIDAATNTPVLFQGRIEFMRELFESIV